MTDSRLLVHRAILEFDVLPLVVDTPGDSEVSGELHLSDILYSRVEVLEGAASIDVREEVRRFDGVVSSSRASEIVRNRHW